MRYIAPERGQIPPDVYEHPVFAGFSPEEMALCRQLPWPEIDDLNAYWQPPFQLAGKNYRFQAQDQLLDGKHYEMRIYQDGVIATRRSNWHDLFNAFVWKRHALIKSALNRRQCRDIQAIGPRERTRAQYAMTQFDEAGAILRLADDGMLEAWDAHDWPRFFRVWDDVMQKGRLQLWLFGHSIHEHALNPGIALVAKALVIDNPLPMHKEEMDVAVAEAIGNGLCLNDPQELRPIPLTGIPGWHPEHNAADFFERVPCFQPKRVGKIYPPPLKMA